MRPVKKSNKKLFLNKVTIARLEVLAMDKIYGGDPEGTYTLCDTYCAFCPRPC